MTPSGGRLLGVDLGQVRIGLALSDPLGMTAQPLEAVPAVGPRKDVERVAVLASERDVATIVVGLPLLLSGEEGDGARSARLFAERLSDRLGQVRIELWDERLTTVQAERVLIEGGVRRRRRKQLVDGIAAALILQSFLDAQDAGGAPTS